MYARCCKARQQATQQRHPSLPHHGLSHSQLPVHPGAALPRGCHRPSGHWNLILVLVFTGIPNNFLGGWTLIPVVSDELIGASKEFLDPPNHGPNVDLSCTATRSLRHFDSSHISVRHQLLKLTHQRHLSFSISIISASFRFYSVVPNSPNLLGLWQGQRARATAAAHQRAPR